MITGPWPWLQSGASTSNLTALRAGVKELTGGLPDPPQAGWC